VGDLSVFYGIWRSLKHVASVVSWPETFQVARIIDNKAYFGVSDQKHQKWHTYGSQHSQFLAAPSKRGWLAISQPMSKIDDFYLHRLILRPQLCGRFPWLHR
jgi:hypothetical protein